MPPLVVRDNSIGEAISAIGSGLFPSPKGQWDAAMVKQRYEENILDYQRKQAAEREAERVRAEAERAREAQRAAESALVTEYDRMLKGVPRVEAPRPSTPDFQGPMPAVADPEAAARINTAKAFGLHGIRNTTGAGAGMAPWGQLGMGGVHINGVPTSAPAAARTQTYLTGKLPDASVPLTPGDALAAEERARVRAVELENVRQAGQNQRALTGDLSIPQNNTVYISPERRAAMGLPPEGPVPAQRTVGEKETIIAPDGTKIYGAGVDPNAPKPPGGAFAGTAMDAQAMNTILQVQALQRQGLPVPPELQDAYTLAQWHLTQPTTTYDPATGQPRTYQPALPQFGGSPTPGQVVPDAEPAAVSARAAAAPVPAIGASAPAQVPGQPGGRPTVVTQVPGGTVTGPVPDPKLPGAETRVAATRLGVMEPAYNDVLDILATGYRPTITGQVLTKGQPAGDGILNELQGSVMNNIAGAVAPEQMKFNAAAYNFLNAVLRDESGAAVPESEYPRYERTLIPRSGDPEEVVQAKILNMQRAVAARKAGMSLPEILKLISSPTRPADTSGAGAGAGGGGTPRPGATDMERLRVEANEAIAKIDASGLPGSEKERRKAIINQRLQQSLRGGQ